METPLTLETLYRLRVISFSSRAHTIEVCTATISGHVKGLCKSSPKLGRENKKPSRRTRQPTQLQQSAAISRVRGKCMSFSYWCEGSQIERKASAILPAFSFLGRNWTQEPVSCTVLGRRGRCAFKWVYRWYRNGTLEVLSQCPCRHCFVLATTLSDIVSGIQYTLRV